MTNTTGLGRRVDRLERKANPRGRITDEQFEEIKSLYDSILADDEWAGYDDPRQRRIYEIAGVANDHEWGELLEAEIARLEALEAQSEREKV